MKYNNIIIEYNNNIIITSITTPRMKYTQAVAHRGFLKEGRHAKQSIIFSGKIFFESLISRFSSQKFGVS